MAQDSEDETAEVLTSEEGSGRLEEEYDSEAEEDLLPHARVAARAAKKEEAVRKWRLTGTGGGAESKGEEEEGGDSGGGGGGGGGGGSGGGEHSVMGWQSRMLAPTDPPMEDRSPPSDSLKLAWVYGYEGVRARNNVRLSAAGDVVYHVGKVGVVLDATGNKQRHNLVGAGAAGGM